MTLNMHSTVAENQFQMPFVNLAPFDARRAAELGLVTRVVAYARVCSRMMPRKPHGIFRKAPARLHKVQSLQLEDPYHELTATPRHSNLPQP